ncbi:MAG: hypothetical protein ACSHYA_03170 [Opitutaceae bacterium]
MKLKLTQLILLVCASTFVHADVLTVDNRPNAVAMYTNLGTAITAAQPGDTIQLAGSSTSYGTHTVYKTLHFRGPGYYLPNNNVEGMNQQEATAILHFQSDSQLGNPSGSTVKYMSGRFIGVSDEGLVSFSVSYCRGQVDSVGSAYSSVITITSCDLTEWDGGYRNTEYLAAGSSVRDSIIRTYAYFGPNIVVDRCVITRGVNVTTNASATISNSIFIVSADSTVSNFYSKNDGSVSHCLAVGSTTAFLPAGNGNLNEQYLNLVFKQGSSPDGYYQLAAGSPAIGASSTGGDIGAFPGYRLSGLPSMPRITNLAIDAVATNANGLSFTVDAVAVGTTSE